jgi:arylformamidase
MKKNLALRILTIAGALTLSACTSGAERSPQPRRIVDLSPPLTRDLNVQRLGNRALGFLGSDGLTTCDPVVPAREDLAFGMDRICLLSHSGSHLDAPSRLLRGGEHPGQIALDRLIGPARVVDLRWHDRESALQITDLAQTPINAGDIVILFMGYSPPITADSWPAYAPLSTQASEWLVAKRIRALATDMPAITSFESIAERLRAQQPPEKVWAEYIPFFQAQIPVIAGLVNLETIAQEPSVTFLALPLPTVDGSGAPVRAAAFLY